MWQASLPCSYRSKWRFLIYFLVLNISNRHDYQPWKAKRQRPYNYDREPLHHEYDPRDLKSQYQSEYIERQLPEKIPKQLPEIIQPVPFTSTTDYRTNFLKYPLPMKRPVTKIQYKSAPRQIPWNTTYGTDYLQKPIGGQESFRPSCLDGPNVKQDFGSTTYQNSYIPQPHSKQGLMKDPLKRNLYGNPGQMGNSTYQCDYIEKQPNEDVCPVLALPKRPNKLPGGKSHLTYDAITNRWI